MSLARTTPWTVRAAAIARTAVPQPMSATRWGTSPAVSIRSNARRQPLVVSWWPVPKAIAASMHSASAPSGTLSASWLPWTKKRPADTGDNSRRTWATQSTSGSSEMTKGCAPCEAASSASAISSGACVK